MNLKDLSVLASLGKGVEDEARDESGRWTSGGMTASEHEKQAEKHEALASKAPTSRGTGPGSALPGGGSKEYYNGLAHSMIAGLHRDAAEALNRKDQKAADEASFLAAHHEKNSIGSALGKGVEDEERDERGRWTASASASEKQSKASSSRAETAGIARRTEARTHQGGSSYHADVARLNSEAETLFASSRMHDRAASHFEAAALAYKDGDKVGGDEHSSLARQHSDIANKFSDRVNSFKRTGK